MFNMTGCGSPTVCKEDVYVGYVDNLTYDGIMWKFREGSMCPDKLDSKTDKLYFSIIPVADGTDEAIDKIKQCFYEKTECAVSYYRCFSKKPLGVNTPNIVTNVKIMKEENEKVENFLKGAMVGGVVMWLWLWSLL